MLDTIYIEEKISDHQRVQTLLKNHFFKRIIFIENYFDIFYAKQQNFSLQKENQAIIIAKKKPPFLVPVSKNSYSFSYLQNCPFNCKYCYLQGIYHSANFVFFINFEDYQEAILEKKEGLFLSGFDSDSLAMENILDSLSSWLNFFSKNPLHKLELRTKSTHISSLLKEKPISNVIIAFSLNPQIIISLFEDKTPSLEKRLEAIKILQEKGWTIGIRLDPIIYQKEIAKDYLLLIEMIFKTLNASQIESITLGSLRITKSHFDLMIKNPKLFPILSLLEKKGSIYRLDEKVFLPLLDQIKEKITQYYLAEKIFEKKGCPE